MNYHGMGRRLPQDAVRFDENDHEQVEALLLGRTVVEARETEEIIPGSERSHWREHAEGVLVLDDGTRLYLKGNDGGCWCSAGCYPLRELNGTPNVITKVEFVDAPGGDDEEHYEGYYSIYVYAENRKINLATFEGSDGNGYYGTGYRIYVVAAERAGEAA